MKELKAWVWVVAVTATTLVWTRPLTAQRSGADLADVATAVRAAEAPRIDGVLDDAVWATIPAISDFVQREPVDGGIPSERTEVRIAFDSDNLYFGFMLYDSEPELIRRSILHREGRIDQDDHVWIVLDSYLDRRNGYVFELNSIGTQGDALFSDESLSLDDWNWEGVYRSEARVTDEGWSLEVAIPFTTIRFAEAEAPEMGVAIRRVIRRKNEQVMWPHIPQRFRSGITQVSQFATLEGLRDLRKGRHIEVKPFLVSGAERRAGDDETNVLEDVGLDVKYSVTSNLTADLTWNTDFAQVEADNVQVNLTRFNLFFPEKREFFLERAGLFSFGKARETELFFSRTVGLSNEILGGGRVTGQIGKLSVGALSLQTKDATIDDALFRGANNSVIRLRGDVLPRTTVGGLVTNLQNSEGHNRSVGGDAQVRFWGSSTFSAWYASVWDSERDRSSAGSVAVAVQPQRSWSARAGFDGVGEDFRPGLGFVRRRDMRKYSGNVAWTPRFEASPWARSLVMSLGGDRTDGQDGVKQSTSQILHNMLSLQSGDWLSVNVRRRAEELDEGSSIQGRPLQAGSYQFTAVDGSFQTDQSRVLSGGANLSVGNFWNGTRTQYGGSLGWKTGPYLTLTGKLSRNDINLPVENGDFTTTVLSLDVLGAISRKLFANALFQWDDVSDVLNANIRINWIHTPGSDLFFVIDSGYFTQDFDEDVLNPLDTRWLRRTGILKITYLKAF